MSDERHGGQWAGPFVDRDCRCDIATAEARHFDELDVGVVLVAPPQLGDARLAVAQEAREVVADVHRDLGRRLSSKMGVERDQALDLVQRPAGIAGQLLQLLTRQPPALRLDQVERRDQRRAGELPCPRLDSRYPAGSDVDEIAPARVDIDARLSSSLECAPC